MAYQLRVAGIGGILSLTALCALLLSGCNLGGTSAAVPKDESVYDRVIRTGVIRAAYISYPPACMKHAQTGEMSGIFVETLEKAAKNLGLKVDWTNEVGWSAQIEGLQRDQYDIVGSPVWANPNRGKLTTLSKPLYYSGIGIYVRKNESRFSDWRQINSPSVRIATIDGETGDLIARTQFSNAKRLSSPQDTNLSLKFLDITGNKADVFFTEPYFAYKFLESNRGTIKNIASDNPIRTLGNCYMFKKGEPEFKQMLDVALEDLLNSGYVDQLLDKYEPAKNTYYRVAQPYRIVK